MNADLSNKIKEIKSCIASATSAESYPWRYEEGEEASKVVSANGLSITWDDHNGEVFSPEVASYISQSIDFIMFLIDELTSASD